MTVSSSARAFSDSSFASPNCAVSSRARERRFAVVERVDHPRERVDEHADLVGARGALQARVLAARDALGIGGQRAKRVEENRSNAGDGKPHDHDGQRRNREHQRGVALERAARLILRVGVEEILAEAERGQVRAQRTERGLQLRDGGVHGPGDGGIGPAPSHPPRLNVAFYLREAPLLLGIAGDALELFHAVRRHARGGIELRVATNGAQGIARGRLHLEQRELEPRLQVADVRALVHVLLGLQGQALEVHHEQRFAYCHDAQGGQQCENPHADGHERGVQFRYVSVAETAFTASRMPIFLPSSYVRP
ncbi:MAG: hypothetical protein M3Q55_16435 [Acidobacteriota bacterium]|nr:hypothetical protein [Acidobacteriota bacterium]